MIVLALLASGSFALGLLGLPWFPFACFTLGHEIGHYEDHTHVTVGGLCFAPLLLRLRLRVHQLVVVEAVVRLLVRFRNGLQLSIWVFDICVVLRVNCPIHVNLLRTSYERVVVPRYGRSLNHAASCQLVPSMHHFLEYFVLPRLSISLVLFTDHILSRIVP